MAKDRILEVDPDVAWRVGVRRFIRWRWLVGYFLGSLGLSSVAAFLLKHPWLGAVILAAVLPTVIVLGVLRRLLFRRTVMHRDMHSLVHQVRDISGRAEAAKSEGDEDSVLSAFFEFTNVVAEGIAEYFRVFMNYDKTVHCCIRFLTTDGYETLGRSHGMNPERAKMSIPIPPDQGIPGWFLDNDPRGIIIVHDIEAEAERGRWYRTPTDRFEDVKTMMIAPINGYVRGDLVFLGLLFITSPRDPFTEMHALPLKGLADLLGAAYPCLLP